MFLFFDFLSFCALYEIIVIFIQSWAKNFSTLQTKISLGLSRQKYEKQGGLSEIFDQSVLKSFFAPLGMC
jgi:hypothetical protein